MGLKKQSYHHGDLPEQIAEIAWEKLRLNGGDKLSLRSCAREVGVDAAAVYRHFKSKDALLIHLANRAFSDLANAMETAERRHLDQNPKEALVQIGLAYIGQGIREPHIFHMMFDIAGRYAEECLVAGFSDEGREAYSILVSAIERLNPKGPVDVHAMTLWSMVHGFSKLVNSGLGPGSKQLDLMSRAICETVVETIV